MRVMLKSKLHRAVVTESNRDYPGSITIDSDLMQTVDILPYEQVDIYNITSGNRLTTYAIQGEAGSGTFCINGAAAHMADVGDRIIVCSYSHVNEESARSLKPKIVVLDEANRPVKPVAV